MKSTLRQIREGRYLKAKELSQHSGVRKLIIMAIEAGELEATPNQRRRIARALKVLEAECFAPAE